MLIILGSRLEHLKFNLQENGSIYKLFFSLDLLWKVWIII